MSATARIDPLYATARSTVRFIWTHLISIVGISLGWFLAALPVVTVGPATVGAYQAVLSLRTQGRIEREAVLLTIRQQFVHAMLIGLIPVVLGAVSAIYGITYLRTGVTTSGILALAGFNVAIYTWLVSIPTLVGLADGKSAVEALTVGYLWTAQHAVGAVALGMVTVVLFAVSSLLTVAMVVLFAGVTFAFHVEFVVGVSETEPFGSPAPKP